MELTEKTLSQDTLFQGRIINLRVDKAILPNGSIATREIVEHPGGVCVAAVTENNEILLVSQFRYPYSKVIKEIPAGKLERGEDPYECGIRELKEETGAIAQNFELLGQMYPTPGYCEEIIHIYYASGLTFGEISLDEDEFLNCESVPIEKAVEMVDSGEIKDAKTQIAILKVARRLGI